MKTYEKVERQNKRFLLQITVIIFGSAILSAGFISAYFFGLKDLGQDWSISSGIICFVLAGALAIARPYIRKSGDDYLAKRLQENPDGIWMEYGS